jgi:hypothetical protein
LINTPIKEHVTRALTEPKNFPHCVIPRIAQEQYFVGKAFRLLKLRASYPILKLA